MQLYATNLGAERLETTVDSPTFDVPDGPQAVPLVDITASRSADGRRYILKAINTSLDAAVRLRVRIDGAPAPAPATQHVLTAPTLQTATSFATPDAVSVQTRQVTAGRAFTVDLPRHSVSVIVLGGSAR
jgi:alpha-L-arabinofuranosidase